MKPQKIKLSIDNPCKQDWNSMTANEQGKFCDHCAKSVIDFSKMSDREIVQIISAKQGSDRICGRASSSQLKRYLLTEKPVSVSSPYKFVAGLFIASSVNSFAAPAIHPKAPVKESFLPVSETNEKSKPKKDTLVHVIEGKVVGSDSVEPSPFVEVKIRGTEIKAVSDMDGKFKLVLPDTMRSQLVTIYAESPDGYSLDRIVDRSKDASSIALIMDHMEFIMGDVVTIKPKRWWQFWK